MKVMPLILGISLLLSIGSLCLPVALIDENCHELSGTVLCRVLEMKGNFDLEFGVGKPYQIWNAEVPVPLHFKNLHIETESIFVDDASLDNVGKKIRIVALEPTTQLYIYEIEKPADVIFISRIKAASENAEISFFSDSEESFVSFGKNSVISLENYYSTREWFIEIKGRFQVIGEKYAAPMKDKNIRFLGSMKIENPQLSNSENMILDFDFYYDVKKLQLNEGHTLFRSDVGSVNLLSDKNAFMVESNGIVSKNEVIEDGFRIDMTKEFYQKDEYFEKFHIEDVRKMNIYDIEAIEDRLSVKFHVDYYGETLFPKILTKTRYYIISKEGLIGDLLVELSNLDTSEKGIVTFLPGNEYMIEIYVEKLVKDDIVVGFEHRDLQEVLIEYNIYTEIPYKFTFRCPLSFLKKPFRVYTEFSYYKENEENTASVIATDSFYAVIEYGGIEFRIEDNGGGIPYKVRESGKLLISKKITLESEISDLIEVNLSIDGRGEFEITRFEYYPTYFHAKGDTIYIEVELKAPSIEREREVYEIKIILFYRLKDDTGYILYLPDPTRNTTIVENIIVEKSFLNYFIERIPITVLLVLSSIISFGVLYMFFPRSKYEDILDEFLKMYITKDEAKLKIMKFIVSMLIFTSLFVLLMMFLSLLLYIF
jgi:hypothetical protein